MRSRGEVTLNAADSTQPVSSPAPTPVPVAIIGMGCLFPGAGDLARYWANIRDRRDAITEVPATHWRPEDYYDPDPKAPDRTYARRGGFLDPVDFPALEFGIAPNNLDATDTTQLLGLLAARAALEDAGYGPDGGRPLDRSRVSVILGVTGTLELVIPLGARLGHPIWRRALQAAGVDDATADDVVRRIGDAYVGWQENSFPGLLGNVAAGRIANRLDLGGTNCVVDAACASALAALDLALHELADGRCDLALSGGLDTFNDIFMYMCFSKTPALSPTGDARPFDAEGDGTILGEGLGVLVLKRLEDARRDGDRVYAVIRGMGTSSDGRAGAIYAPSAAGQVQALRRAYARAQVAPATVELVEAHGTGTKVGDATELSALAEVYRGARAGGSWCALGSVKSQIGHTKAAAGVAGLIKAALALHHKVLPPTIKVSRPIETAAPGRSPFYINTEPRPWLPRPEHPRRAAVSAFGFGGSNFHCVLEEARPEKAATDWEGDVQIVAFSAGRRDALAEALDGWPRDPTWDALRVASARSRAAFRADDACRLVLVVGRERADLGRLLERARTLVLSGRGAAAEGIYYGEGPAAGGLAFLFPGQGSQYVGMLRALACRFPAFLDALAEADALPLDDGRRLGDLIYPQSAFDDARRAEHESALRATEVAQPALGAVSLGALGVLESFGVRPDAVAGHSYGELTALCASGRIDARALGRLSRLRGRLMAGRDGAGRADAGSMLAVRAPLDRVASALRNERLDLVIANKNSPDQAVLSGPSAEIDRAARVFDGRGIASRMLDVAAAFHSRFVADARGPFAEALRAVAFAPARVPVFANATAAAYPDDPEAARALLADQLARPVEFVDEVEALYRAGVRTFLEVGPDRKLTGLVGAILAGREHAALAVDASRGQRDNLDDLARALAQLAALGHPVRLPLWDEGADRPATPHKPGLTVKVCGANPAPRPKPAAPSAASNQSSSPPIRPKAGNSIAHPATSTNLNPNPDASSTMTTTTPARPPRSHVSTNGNGDPTAPIPPGSGRNGHPTATAPEHASGETNGVAPSASPLTAPAPIPALRSNDPALLAEAIRHTQDNLIALQKLGEQTAQLHRQFLDGQDRTRRTFQSLLEQQQKLVLASIRLEPPASSDLPTRAEPSPLPGPVATRLAPPSRPDEEEIAQEPPSRDQNLSPSSLVGEGWGGQTPGPSRSIGSEEFTAPASTTAPASATAEADTAHIQAVLLSIVSEKTGYPAEMLEPAMRLDADLGIDSIKRVEILSALQEQLPDAPVIGAEHLGTLQTLADIGAFLAGAGSRDAGTRFPEDPGTGLSDATGSAANPCAPAAGPAHGFGDEPVASAASSRAAVVQETLLSIVSEKTGYPAEMLEPAMRLDADLGIDSIKRVEILSALQEQLPDAPVIGAEHLGTLQTLADIGAFLAESDPVGTVAGPGDASPPTQPSPTRGEGPDADSLPPRGGGSGWVDVDAPHARPGQHDFRAIDDETRADGMQGPAIQRLIPRSIPLDEQRPRTTVRLRPGGEVWVADVGDDPGDGLAPALSERLRARGYQARVIRRAEIGDLDAPTRLDGLLLLGPAMAEGGDDAAIKDAFRLLRGAAPALRRAGREGDGSALLATVSRLDGAFGFGPRGLDPRAIPVAGGLAGLAKTAGHEWPEVACKAIDLDPAFDRSEQRRAAEAVVTEVLRCGPAEVGLSRDGQTTLALSPASIESGRVPPLVPGDVVVISGGARGITAEVAVALAEASRPTIVLLGRSPAPAPEPDWLAAIDGRDEAAIKRALATRANGRATPQAIGEQSRRVMAGREIARNLRRIEAAGATVVYRAVDVRDADAVRACLDDVRRAFGPIRGLIHGAGVLADRRIEDQTDAQFADVYDTKVAGLRSLLGALGPDADALRVLVLFSSSTARFGRSGQVAYAAANEVLNKWARSEAQNHPACRVVSVNWGPWDGGMVNDALKPLFESEGIALIHPRDGARHLVAEIQATGATGQERPVEVVILGGTSLPDGLMPGHEPAAPRMSNPTPAPSASPDLRAVFERPADVATIPVLRSHVIDGRPVLPMVLILEWLVQGALQRNPGLVFCGVEDLRLLKGVIVRDDAPAPELLRVLAGKAIRSRDDRLYRIAVELRGTSADGREFRHARGTVVLGDRPLQPQGEDAGASAVPALMPYHLDPRAIYRDVLFHGPEMRGIERVEGCDERGIVADCRTSPPPSAWIDRPLRQAWLTDPLALDGAFQALVLWSVERSGACSLPTFVGRYRQFRRAFPPDRVRVVARVTQAAELSARADIALLDDDGSLVALLNDYECVIDASLNQAFRRNQLARAAH
jgi:acyl transferase domain-containing protein/NADP-dependent 3-hydroxy acid dehydrogenase YdfG/acyl carrier protein